MNIYTLFYTYFKFNVVFNLNCLRGRLFTTDQQLDVTLHAWHVSQHKTFYSEVIKWIVRWWTKWIVKQGDCVEKLCSCKISALVFLNMKHTVRIIIDSPSYIYIYICNNVSTYYMETFCIIKSIKSVRVGEGKIFERWNSSLQFFVLYVKVTTDSSVLLP